MLSSLRMDEQPLTEEQLFELRQEEHRPPERIGREERLPRSAQAMRDEGGPPAEACGYSAACTGLAAVVGVEEG